ncbi:MAG: glycosyltransferase family 39 protein [Chloroflexota bacterium]|mgnify:FL=1
MNKYFLAALATLFIFNLIFLQSYPPPLCDEATYASNAEAVIKQGNFGLTIWTAGEPFGRDQNMVHMGRLAALGEALLFKIVGMSWWAGRFYSLIAWLISTILIYQIGKRHYNVTVGAAASLLFAASFKSFLSGHLGRPDAWANTSLLFAIFILLELITKQKSFRFAILAGVIGIVPFDYHGNGLWFLIAFCGVVFIEYGLIKREWRNVFGYALGVIIGATIWILAHFLPSPAQSWYQLTAGHNVLGGVSSASGIIRNLELFAIWLRESFWTIGGPLGLMDAVFAITGIIAALRNRTQINRVMAIIAVISLLTFAFGMGQKFGMYAYLWMPIFYLMGAAAIRDWVQVVRIPVIHMQNKMVWAAIIGGVIALNISGSLWFAYRFKDSDYVGMSERIQHSLPKGARVLADPTWWWSLSADYKYLNDEYVPYSIAAANARHSTDSYDQIVAAMMGDLDVNYVLLDEAIACYDGGGADWIALKNYVNTNCQTVGAVSGPWNADPNKRYYPLAQKTIIYKCPPKSSS